MAKFVAVMSVDEIGTTVLEMLKAYLTAQTERLRDARRTTLSVQSVV